jgi:hypothetical protein
MSSWDPRRCPFLAGGLSPPQTVLRVTKDREPRRPPLRLGSVSAGTESREYVALHPVDGNAESQGDLLRNPWASPDRVPLFHGDDGGDDVLARSLGARLRRPLGREELTIPSAGSALDAGSTALTVEDDRGTDQPALAHQERTQASNHPIRGTEIR